MFENLLRDLIQGLRLTLFISREMKPATDIDSVYNVVVEK